MFASDRQFGHGVGGAPPVGGRDARGDQGANTQQPTPYHPAKLNKSAPVRCASIEYPSLALSVRRYFEDAPVSFSRNCFQIRALRIEQKSADRDERSSQSACHGSQSGAGGPEHQMHSPRLCKPRGNIFWCVRLVGSCVVGTSRVMKP